MLINIIYACGDWPVLIDAMLNFDVHSDGEGQGVGSVNRPLGLCIGHTERLHGHQISEMSYLWTVRRQVIHKVSVKDIDMNGNTRYTTYWNAP